MYLSFICRSLLNEVNTLILQVAKVSHIVHVLVSSYVQVSDDHIIDRIKGWLINHFFKILVTIIAQTSILLISIAV